MSINFFVKKNAVSIDSKSNAKSTEIFYACVDEFWRKEEKYHYLDSKEHCQNIDWQRITPDKRHTWLTEGLHAEFDTFIPMGSKEMKAKRRKTVVSQCDFQNLQSRNGFSQPAVMHGLYNFNENALSQNVKRTMMDFYNAQVLKMASRMPEKSYCGRIDDFVSNMTTPKSSWSSGLKQKLKLQQGRLAEFPDIKASACPSVDRSQK